MRLYSTLSYVCKKAVFFALFFSNLKLRFKLIIAFLIIAIIPILIIGYFSYNSAVKTILNNSEQHTLNILDKVDKHMTSKILYANYTALSITTSRYISESIVETQTPLDLSRNIRKVEGFFTNLIASRQDIADIIIVDTNNIKYGTEYMFASPNFYIKDSEYYKRAVEGNGDIVWIGMYDNIISSYSMSKVLVAVSLIYDVFNDKIRGVLIINMKPQSFQEILNNLYEKSDRNITFIVDQNSNIISSGTNTYNYDIKEIISGIDVINGSTTKVIDNKKLLITCKVNDITGWKIINAIPVSELISSANEIKRVTTVLIVISVLLIILLAYIISYSITMPISSLIYLMEKATQGNLNIYAQSTRRDEVGVLSNSFNIMLEKIRSLISEVYEEKVNQNKAELEALQAQINPHFLYNTLDTINWMLIEQGQFEAGKIVRALGDLMKYCIKKDNSIVSIQQEINHIENYLLIQKARLECRLEYNIHVSDEVKHSKIPKLIIQPIVENAIVHGIEKKSSKGILEICADRRGDSILIIVEDNGMGMELNVLESLMNFEQNIEGTGHTRIGIKNVDRRIKLRFGNEYGIHIKSEENKGTKVIITLPWFA